MRAVGNGVGLLRKAFCGSGPFLVDCAWVDQSRRVERRALQAFLLRVCPCFMHSSELARMHLESETDIWRVRKIAGRPGRPEPDRASFYYSFN